MGKGGRKRKFGERKPSGDLKNPEKPAEGIAPAVWARMRIDAAKVFEDSRYGSQLGRLSQLRELTDAQTTAGFRIGEIYRRYYRAKGWKVFPKIPSWERGFGNADLAEERMSDDQLGEHEAQIRSATEAWLKVSETMMGLREQLRNAVYDLCVLDLAVSAVLLPGVRVILDHFARRQERGSQATQARLKTTTAAPEVIRAAMPKHIDAGLRAVELIARKIRTDFGDLEIAEVKETYLALVDRERFRARTRKP